jgi:hypothetical protein
MIGYKTHDYFMCQLNKGRKLTSVNGPIMPVEFRLTIKRLPALTTIELLRHQY